MHLKQFFALSASIFSVVVAADVSWDEAYSEAKELLAKLTLTDKVTLVTGSGWMKDSCVGNLPAMPKIGFPGMCLQDSPTGVRFTDKASAFSASMNVAATFDKNLMYNHGVAMGEEFYGKGVNVQLGPMMNMARAPAGGRNWEGSGGDPYLTSVCASQQVRGIQSTGVIATAKHFILNEQEIHREGGSSQIDTRTLHEVYLPPFKACIDADVGAVMCSYNRVNGKYACEQPETLLLLKDTLGFKGFVMTDWWAAISTENTANGGTDVMMPGGKNQSTTDSYFGANLEKAVNAKTVSEDRVDDMVLRVLAPWIKFGQNKGYPHVNFNSWDLNKGNHTDVQGNHKQHIREVGAASSILVKNVQNALPITSSIKTIAIIGNDAANPAKGINSFADHGGIDGTVAQGWGSGTSNYPYLISPIDGITAQATELGIKVVSHLENYDLKAASSVAASSDLAIVFVNSDSGEEYITVGGNMGDRNNITLWGGGDALIEEVAKVKKLIVVIHSPGAVEMPWLNNPNVVGVIFALFPGQESGNSIADVLFNKVNPSGRLPFTVAGISEYGASIDYKANNAPGLNYPIFNYTEGLYIDYRWFDLKNIKPVFSFGHGLSYSTFAYSNIQLTNQVGQPPIISIDILNTGKFDGNEVPQLYISFPKEADEPVKVLKGFERVFIKKNEKVKVTFALKIMDVSMYDVLKKGWRVVNGDYVVNIGASSADLRVSASFNCINNICKNKNNVEEM